jgi:hypothetical protein
MPFDFLTALRIKICRVNVCDFNDLSEFKYGTFTFTWLKFQYVSQYKYILSFQFVIISDFEILN